MMRMAFAGAMAALLATIAWAAPLQNVPVSVQVLDAQGQPVSGGKVYLAGKPVGTAVKDGLAQGVCAKVAPGVRYVTYVADGLLAVRRVRVRDGDTAVTAAIRVGAETVAEGAVTTTDGAPVPRATLQCTATMESFAADERGGFRVDGFCLDEATLNCHAVGFIAKRSARITEPFPTSIRLVVARAAMITVAITDAGGAPIANAEFGAHTATQGLWGRPEIALFREGKRYDAEVYPGKVRVVAFAAGYAPEVQELTAKEGEWVDLRFRLKPLATVSVSGVVVAPDGQTPVPRARVTLSDPLDSLQPLSLMSAGRRSGPMVAGYLPRISYRGVSDEGGRFQFSAPPGRYNDIEVVAEGYAVYRRFSIEVEGPSSLRLQLSRGGRVEGTVRLPDGSLPPEGTHASLLLPIGESAFMSPEADVSPETGRFAFERVRPGPATLTISASGYVAKAKFEVSEGQVVEPELRFQTQEPVRIVGRVIDRRDGKPIPMATVRASAAEGPSSVEAVTEDDGSFELAPLPAGKVHVGVSLPGYTQVSETVDGADGGVQDLTLKTSPGGRIEGEVAQALLAGDVPPSWVNLRGAGEFGGSAEVDEQGHFALSHVAPGSYTLELGEIGASRTGTAQEVTVAEGQATRVVVGAR